MQLWLEISGVYHITLLIIIANAARGMDLSKNPENYDHTIIPGGFHNKELFEALKDIFDRLAANAEKFFCWSF